MYGIRQPKDALPDRSPAGGGERRRTGEVAQGRDGAVALFLGVVEVWRQTYAGARAVVAEDVSRQELVAQPLGVLVPDRDGAAAPLGVARRAHGEAGRQGGIDQAAGEGEGALADA